MRVLGLAPGLCRGAMISAPGKQELTMMPVFYLVLPISRVGIIVSDYHNVDPILIHPQFLNMGMFPSESDDSPLTQGHSPLRINWG